MVRILCFVLAGLAIAPFVAAQEASWRGAAAPLADSATRAEVFVVGRISSDPRRTQPRLEAMAGYLAGKLADHGYRRGTGIVAANESEMAHLLRDGHVDLVSESALSAIRLSDASGAEIVLREWKDRVPVYHSLIFVKKDSPIYSLRDLLGRRIALEDRGSTTGFLVPLATLRAAGLPLIELASPTEEVPNDAVGFVLSAGELNISAWVARGLVEAGGFSDADFEDNDRTPKRIRSELRAIHMSPPIVRSLVLLSSKLKPQVRAALLEALLAMGSDGDATEVRQTYYRLRRYDGLDDITRASLDDIRRQAASLGSLLN